MTEAPFADELMPGETLLAHWAPSFAIYLRREAVVVGLTALGFVPAIWAIGDPRAWVALPLVVLVDLFLFDTLGDWQRSRRMRWLLTDRRVIQVDTLDPTETRSIAIPRIARLRRLLFWRLYVVDEERQIITLSYVPDLAALRDRLAEAREAAA